ncbi:hypothetical protein BJ138DRAFT_1155019 [Hygrophoropsis aurantiaca]|uniref:Uncharacterized protein n=1 Tax=Hygrophoropsis aurantiaca TaxID=72124 RepID=A0ACB8A908_9AGAM|nr:hypothetical protein BJ138DRAFT_1155019 [Hygrophoropsis aurantiaca]
MHFPKIGIAGLLMAAATNGALASSPSLKANGWKLDMYAGVNYNAEAPGILAIDSWNGVIGSSDSWGEWPPQKCLHSETMKEAKSLKFWNRNKDPHMVIVVEFFAKSGCTGVANVADNQMKNQSTWFQKDLTVFWFNAAFGKKGPGSFRVSRLELDAGGAPVGV